MPLDSVPPPSPVGKSAPPLRGHCNCREATRCCDIPISQIRKRFHFIPRAFVDTVFFPPAIPAWVLRHIKAHPPTWTWTLRAGPRAGTTLTVPTVPIHCASDAHRAVRWLVSVFHTFKGSLRAESSITIADGKVISPLVCIYQNNMLLHIDAQMGLYDRLHPPKDHQDETTRPQSQPQPAPRARPSHTRTTNTPAPQPPPQKHTSCSAEIAALRTEIEVLRKKLDASLEHPPPPSPRTILATVRLPSCPSSPSPSTSASVRSRTPHPDYQWLQPILDHKHCPPFLVSVDSSMAPSLCYAIPEDVQQVLQVQCKGHPPMYVGIDSNGDLQVAGKADGDLITLSIVMPSDWTPPWSYSHFSLPACDSNLVPVGFTPSSPYLQLCLCVGGFGPGP